VFPALPSLSLSARAPHLRRSAELPRLHERSSDFALVLTARLHVVLLEEPGLMGEHDRLHAVAEVELLKDVRDVRLDGGLADVELVPDLRV
jgi:hypothetical protein